MMNLILILAIVLINVISIVIVCKILKKLTKKDIIIFLAVCVTIIYFTIQFVYLLSGIGIDATIHNEMKNMIIFMFVPIDMIVFVPYVASKYIKLKNKDVNIEDLKTKLIILVALFIVVSVVEFFYFRSIQQNTKQIGENANSILSNQLDDFEQENTVEQTNIKIENNVINDIVNDINTNDIVDKNSLVENYVSNSVVQNTTLENIISNSIVNNIN